MRIPNNTISNRKIAFKKRVLQLQANKQITYDEFLEGTPFRVKKDQHDKEGLTPRTISRDLKTLEDTLRPRRVITNKIGLTVVDEEKGTSFRHRKQSAVDVKECLSEALWHFLFGENWQGSTKRSSPAYQSYLDADHGLAGRVQALRFKNQLYFAADAGSTTLSAISTLLKAEKIPFEIGLGAKEGASRDFRTMEPVLLTNSFPIAEAVVSSDKHRWSFIVEFVGGIMRPGRSCTTGELTSLWLHVCCAEGRFGLLDLAIVGVTGVIMGVDDVASVTCDDAEEATLKRKFLSMAGSGELSSGIRIMVFHAAKLLYQEARCRFAVITKSMVDLIVVDSGANAKEAAAVANFVDKVKNRVDVLVVTNPNYSPKPLENGESSTP